MSAKSEQIINTEVRLPAHTEADLRLMHGSGLYRYGILALLLDPKDRMLLLEHRQTDKSSEGSWGTLGETSQVFFDGMQWQIEPVSATLLRGINEETGATVAARDLHLPNETSFFETTWPVGRMYENKRGYAVTPVVRMSPDVTEAIMDAPLPSEEISAKRLVRLEDVPNYEPLRNGMDEWLHQAGQVVLLAAAEYSAPLSPEQWQPRAPLLDARLDEMFA